MIDTHTHLYMGDYADGGTAAVDAAVAAGVSRMVLPNVDLESVGPMMTLNSRRPDKTCIAAGLHPTEVGEDWQEVLAAIFELTSEAGIVAVGEAGIDLHWEDGNLDLQRKAFAAQLEEASRRHLPVIIHSRDALEETLRLAVDVADSVPALLFHSFTGTPADARRILEEIPGAMFGINGVVTFKNAGALREAVGEIGIDRIVLETDSPYLAPVPHRGSCNESAYLPHILAVVADVCGVSRRQAETLTDAAATWVFGLDRI